MEHSNLLREGDEKHQARRTCERSRNSRSLGSPGQPAMASFSHSSSWRLRMCTTCRGAWARVTIDHFRRSNHRDIGHLRIYSQHSFRQTSVSRPCPVMVPSTAFDSGKRRERIAGLSSPGRHCHSTRSLAAIGCHSLGICTVILLSLLSFSAEMRVSPIYG